jgi:hypothetical protein
MDVFAICADCRIQVIQDSGFIPSVFEIVKAVLFLFRPYIQEQIITPIRLGKGTTDLYKVLIPLS